MIHIYERVEEFIRSNNYKFITKKTIATAYENITKSKCTEFNARNIIKKLIDENIIRAHISIDRQKTYLFRDGTYNAVKERPAKDDIRGRLIDIFNEHTKDGDRVITLETEKFIFIKGLEKDIKPIVSENERNRFLEMCRLNPCMDIRYGDIDQKIKDGHIGSGHYFLDYCDTFDKHIDTIKYIANTFEDGKLFALSFSADRHYKRRKETTNTNQLARAIKITQDIFRKNGYDAQLLDQQSYRDGMTMNTLCFKVNKIYREPVEKTYTASEVIEMMKQRVRR
jgi:hypothetical protein